MSDLGMPLLALRQLENLRTYPCKRAAFAEMKEGGLALDDPFPPFHTEFSSGGHWPPQCDIAKVQ